MEAGEYDDKFSKRNIFKEKKSMVPLTSRFVPRVKKRGSTSLRELLLQIEKSADILAEYRPDVASKILKMM